ncbi:GNAT family N-acetyltransferase [Rothia sp. (in: high G+C Gram-positive bacteria)]|uniref:GNAT family N-acetyltransferase n=1 Tax=Rothia sp. (in: high G+C Gram-positive bacteria) TaxID=1885016 RepID=UPI0034CF0933
MLQYVFKNAEDTLNAYISMQLELNSGDNGAIDLAVNTHGEILGVALWEAPNRPGSLAEDLKNIGTFMRMLGPRRFIRGVIQELTLLHYHPKFEHWYLNMIGVSTSARGLDVGTALLEHGIARLDGVAAYLESSTPDSAALYARQGFVPVGGFGKRFPGTAMFYPAAMPKRSTKH